MASDFPPTTDSIRSGATKEYRLRTTAMPEERVSFNLYVRSPCMIACDLSVEGPPVKSGPPCVVCPLPPGRPSRRTGASGKVERPTGRTTLPQARTVASWDRRTQSLSYGEGITSCATGRDPCAWAPRLISVLGETPGDMMVDRVTRVTGCGRSVFFGRPRWSCGGSRSAGADRGASTVRTGRARTGSIPSGRPGGEKDIVSQLPQEVVRPAAQLAGHGQARPVVSEAPGDLREVGVVGGGRTGGALGGLVQGPPEHSRTLPGQVPGGPAIV